MACKLPISTFVLLQPTVYRVAAGSEGVLVTLESLDGAFHQGV